MNIKKIMAKYMPVYEEPKPSVAEKLLKAALITGAVLAFVPTVYKINGDEGFDGYGLLSHLKYVRKTDDEGNVQSDWFYTLIDLSRFSKKKEISNVEVENDEDSSCVQK